MSTKACTRQMVSSNNVYLLLVIMGMIIRSIVASNVNAPADVIIPRIT